MRILIHDNVRASQQPRTEYIVELVNDQLSRFAPNIHQVEATLICDGHNGSAVIQCRLTATLGSLGVVASGHSHANEHEAIKGAIRRLTRGISRRINKRQTSRRRADIPATELVQT